MVVFILELVVFFSKRRVDNCIIEYYLFLYL